MSSCPKCGSCRIAGPTYRSREGFRKECLLYTCMECGYVQREQTLEQRRPQKAAEERLRR